MYKLPLTREQSDKLHNWLREKEAATKNTHKQLVYRSAEQRKIRFSSLSPEIRPAAEANLKRYLTKPETVIKLRTFPPKRRAALYASLCACAAAHAAHPGLMGPYTNKQLRQKRKYMNKVRRVLGLKGAAPYIPRVSHYTPQIVEAMQRDKVAAIHPGHGEPVAAEPGQTNMDGI